MDDENNNGKRDREPENQRTQGETKGSLPEGAEERTGDEQAREHREELKRETQHIVFWMLVGLVILLTAAIIPRIVRRHQLAVEKQRAQNAVPSVTVAEAQAVAPTVTVELSGTMSAITEAPLLARADGYLVKRYVDIGDRVKQGQLLAIIDSPDLDQQVRQAQAGLRESQSALTQAQQTLDQAQANQGLAAITAQRWARLQTKGAVSRQDNDTNQTNYKAQSAYVSASNAGVEIAAHNVASNRANLGRLVYLQNFEQIRAPFDGVITDRNLDVGALISQASTLLFRMAQIDVLRTYIAVPQTNAPAVKVGSPAWISFAEFPGQTFQATVTRMAHALDPVTRTMLTEVRLPNREHRVFPGMYATVKMMLPTTRTSAVIIPGEAVMIRAAGIFVAVVTKQNTIHLQTISLGHDYGNTVEVLGGVTAREKVVVNPGDDVVEGAKINPVISHANNPASLPTGSGAPGQPAPKSPGQQPSPAQQQSGQQPARQANPSPKENPPPKK